MSSSPVSPEAFPPEPAAAPASGRPEPAGGASATLIGALMASSAAVLWGTNGVVSSLLFQAGVTPLTLVEARSIITTVGMGGFLLIAARQRLRLGWRTLPLALIFGVSLAIVTYSYFLAIKLLPVAVAVMIQYTGPSLIALYSALVMHRLPSRRVWAALALTLVGVALLAGLGSLLTGGTAASGVTLLGVVVAFGSAIAMAFYILMGERLGQRVHPQTSVFYGFGIASLIWLAFQPPWSFQTLALQPAHLPLVLDVGIIGTLVPFGLFLAAVRRLDATRAAIISTIEPVTAALISWVVLGQGLDPWQIIGGALVLVGVTIVQLKSK